jgi:DNA adenine methylase
MKNRKQAKPFLKWAGGKSQLLETISKHIPPSFKTYYEPFIGSGALFFHLYSQNRIKNAVLADLNKDLIDCYRAVRSNPHGVIECMNDLLKERSKSDHNEHYYHIRNAIRNGDKWGKMKLEKRAACFIYLNKTCFNGLYRENKKGEFNVPTGNNKNVRIFEEDNILAASEALKVAMILGPIDFEEVFNKAIPKKNDFVYLDPPYDPRIGAAASFTQYTKENFGRNEQERLSKLAQKLTDKGCYVMLSNHNTDYIGKLYGGLRKIPIKAHRFINSKSENRINNSVNNELLIVNS